MNLLMDCVAIRQCGSVRLYEPQCVAVRAAVCGSALGSVWQCVRRCVAVRHCAAVCSSVRQCAQLLVCDSAHSYLCATVRAAVCGSV
jgi:hypothetical protein